MTTDPAGDGATEADVTAGLRALSQAYPDLPSAVADRLDRTLAELPELTAPDTAPQPAPPKKLPWWRKRYALASASLAVVAFVAGGMLFAAQPWSMSAENGASSAQDQSEKDAEPFENKDKGDSEAGDQPSVHTEVDPYTVTYSGRDYRKSDLAEARDASTSVDKSALPGELSPLSANEAVRDGCVAAVNNTFDGTVESVDFGRYEGEPAMIAAVADDSGGGSAVAVGPQCASSDPQVLGTAKF